MSSRQDMQARFQAEKTWDIIIIGGGASGLGCAVDAATRGLRTLLLEQHDFSKSTSSRSTKLVHGGVRYLKQGNIGLVREALRERGIMYQAAPHLVGNLQFVVPRYSWWEGPFYGIGLKLYDLLAGKLNLGLSRVLDPEQTLNLIPNLEDDNLLGGVIYHDGQFDDSRMAITLALTAAEHGACMLNYAKVDGLLKRGGLIEGVRFWDAEAGAHCEARGSVVINATGIFTDEIRRMDDAEAGEICQPSQGVHIVLDGRFLQGNTAIMVPHTDDGRILFAIPWHGRALVGTTDTPLEASSLEPCPTHEEIGFILRNANRYLEHDPTEEDILSCFAGIRPLIAEGGDANTKTISRKHQVLVAPSGLVTLAGGKWTTYRKMAEDAVDEAIEIAAITSAPCVTETLKLHGWLAREDAAMPGEDHMRHYGSEAVRVEALMTDEPRLGDLIHPRLPYTKAQVLWAARHEMACTVEDILERRTRALILDARAAIEAAPTVAELLARELDRDASWQQQQVTQFQRYAQGYLPPGFAGNAVHG